MLKYKIRKKNVNVEKKTKEKKRNELCFYKLMDSKSITSFSLYYNKHSHTTHSLLLNSAKFNQLVQINYVYES
jgi:hypothetical protein